MKEQFSVGLIVTTYNSPIALDSTLSTLLMQSVRVNTVYIADDGSGAETREVVNRFSGDLPILHVWHEDKGFRRSAILNKAIGTAEEDYLIFIDGDQVLDHRFVADHVRVAAKGSVILGTRCNLLGFHGKPVKRYPNPFHLTGLFLAGRVANDARKRKASYSGRITGLLKGLRFIKPRVRDCDERSARGGNMAAWRSDLMSVNGFDEAFEGWGHEDRDLVLRLARSGLALSQVSFHAVCCHLEHPSSESNDENLAMVYDSRPARCIRGIDPQVREPQKENEIV